MRATEAEASDVRVKRQLVWVVLQVCTGRGLGNRGFSYAGWQSKAQAQPQLPMTNTPECSRTVVSPGQRFCAQQLSHRAGLWLQEWPCVGSTCCRGQPHMPSSISAWCQHQPAKAGPWFGLGCSPSICCWLCCRCPAQESSSESLQGTWRHSLLTA